MRFVLINREIIENDIKYIVNADLAWDKLYNKTILVAGANGFLPAYMIETILYLNDVRKSNINVIGLARNKDKTLHRFVPHLNRSDLKFCFQDVCQAINLPTKIDYVIHAASQASPKYYGIDPVGTLAANVLGTYNLLELAKAHKIERFLYFSSGEVYGEVAPTQIPTSESNYGYIDPTHIRSCYSESKRMGENMCISYAYQYKLPINIARPFHVYGPGMSLEDGRVYADFVADIFYDRDITIYGTGEAVRAFCYLSDATLGFFTLLLKGENLQAYNIGNPYCCLSIMDLAIRLQKLFSEKKLKIIKKNRTLPSNYRKSKISKNCPDISKIIALGWQPQVTIEEGFLKTVRSFYEYDSLSSEISNR
jgi:nucleoside-diphosphate-sugar epimerase